MSGPRPTPAGALENRDLLMRPLVYGVAALAGFVDVIGYVELGGYFVSFMSGTSTKLTLDLLGDWPAALLPLGIIAGFVIGVAAGVLVGEPLARWRAPVILALAAALLGLAGALGDTAPERWALAPLPLAMGVLTTTIGGQDDRPLALTYVTGALVRFAHALAGLLRGRVDRQELRFGLLWLTLAAGGLAGAVAQRALGADALWLAAGAAGLTAGAAALAGAKSRGAT